MDRKRIKILADCPPPPTVKALQDYKDAGLNTYVFTEDDISYSKEPEKYIEALHWMEDLGIDVYIRGLHGADKNFYEKFHNIDFHDYPCIKGLYVIDEPSANKFDDIVNNYVGWRNEKYPDLHWHINLFPSTAGKLLKAEDSDGRTAYQNYLKEYEEKVLKRVSGSKDIGFDVYPFYIKEGECALLSNWLRDAYLVSELAHKNDVDFCACVQVFSGDGWRVLDKDAYMRLQFNTYLAFGINMLEIFVYRSVWTAAEGTFKGMITRDGQKTDYYDFVKTALSEVKLLEEKYLQYNWKGVAVVKGDKPSDKHQAMIDEFLPYASKLPSYVQSIKTEQDCLVGIFEKDGKDALMIVNFNDPDCNLSTTVSISLLNKTIDCATLRGIKTNADNTTCTQQLCCGDGLFLELNDI